jgi:hypothetical protein
MRRRRDPNLKRSRQSISYSSDAGAQDDPILRARPDYHGFLHSEMLIQDVSLAVMPISRYARKKTLSVTLTPPSEATERLIESALGRQEWCRGLESAVREFFRECSQVAMAYGEAAYEIVYISDVKQDKVVGFELAFIQPHTILNRKGQMVQYVPRDIATQRRLPQFVPLSPHRILRFEPPQPVHKEYGPMMESLAILSTMDLPEFALEGARQDRPRIPYDSAIHVKAHKLALAEAGKAIGWNARGLFDEDFLEYYLLHRRLRFERFVIDMRDGIVSKVNDALALAGKELAYSARLEIQGLPTIRDVEAAEQKLAQGSCPFREVLEPFLMS